MIYNEVTKRDFHNSSILRDSFSYDAINALFEFEDELSNQNEKGVEFDPIAIRCDWSEYAEDELFNDFGYLLDEDSYEQELNNLIKLLQNKTTVIELKTTYLIQAF
tara:strand:+ start:128 stop:445 length:318 start_codon:yes stop_codon:yes gene_type:complete